MGELIVSSFRQLGFLRNEYEEELEAGTVELWAISCTTPEFDAQTERLIHCVPELAPSLNLHHQMQAWRGLAAHIRGGLDWGNAEALRGWIRQSDEDKRRRMLINVIELLDGEEFRRGPAIYAREYTVWFKKHGTKKFAEAVDKIRQGRTIVFLCWELTARECHRGLLADWAKKFVNVEFIEPESKIRQTKIGQEIDDPIIDIPNIISGRQRDVKKIVDGMGRDLEAEEFDGRSLFQCGFTTLGESGGAHSAPSQAERLRAGGGDGWIPYEYLAQRGVSGYDDTYDEYAEHVIHGHVFLEDTDMVEVRQNDRKRRIRAQQEEIEEARLKCVEEQAITRTTPRMLILKKAVKP